MPKPILNVVVVVIDVVFVKKMLGPKKFWLKKIYMTHSQIKWDMRLQNVKEIQIHIVWALLYHIHRKTSFQDAKLKPKIFLEFNDFFFHVKKGLFFVKIRYLL